MAVRTRHAEAGRRLAMNQDDPDIVEDTASLLGAAAPPRSYQELRDLLLSGRVKLPKRLAQVASFVVAEPEEVALGTAAGIAERAGVQPSTLVRFSKSVGLNGFSDLQLLFRDRLRSQVSNYDDRLLSLKQAEGRSSLAANILDGFFQAATRSLSQLHDRIDVGQIERAAELLAAADTIYLIAQRRSFPISAYMSYSFGKLGVKNVLIGSPAGTDQETLSFVTKRDAAVAISFSPYASTTIAHAHMVAERNAPLVAITDSPFSPLVAKSSLWFEVVEADLHGFRLLSASLALAMTLTVMVAEVRRGS
ncbi:MurR/RpiR family transcriptional regulator (plasmid) [Roseomonas gilardii subsp. gilardii]|uniref:MurR/RpiR family transcriptional regulator n=1 Tax=Roseomonas gilardii TaxID=257708 RepID=UPI001FFA2E0C|nr:MurR/RpiR family transcriptional regulator [Roseomonas gilardii]UPG74690.1 MurR/RpiR family transcriptional regulator [Roseomonas gilardii subsp. gilardii]